MAFWPRSFLRMALWARHPPSARRVIFVLSVIAMCIAVAAIEWLVGWPDWLIPNHVPRGRL